MWKEFRIAVSFLTRLPLPYQGEWDEKSFSRSSVFFPLVGLIVGILVAAVFWLSSWLGSAMLAAVCTLIASLVITGGIHLDGFMDMCDGIFASRGRERALEIMKDSRVGSFAVLGVVMLMLLKFSLYSAYSSYWLFMSVWDQILTLIAIVGSFVFSRFIMVCCLLWFPSARSEGLGVTIKRHVSKSAPLWGALIMLALFAPTGYYPILIAFVIAALIMVGIAAQVNKFLHGLTGDIYGAMTELGEAVFLLILLIIQIILGHFEIPLQIPLSIY